MGKLSFYQKLDLMDRWEEQPNLAQMKRYCPAFIRCKNGEVGTGAGECGGGKPAPAFVPPGK